MDAARLEQTNADLAANEERYAVLTRDGAYLLTRSGSKGRVLDLETGEALATFPVGDHVGPTPATDGSCFVCNDGESVQVRTLPEADLLDSFPVPGSMRLLGRYLLGPGGEFVYLPGPPWPPGDWTRFQSTTGEAGPQFPGVSIGHPWGADVWAFCVSADGSTAAVTGAVGPVGGGFVGVYEAASGELVDDWQLAGEGSHVALSPDGASVVSVTEGATIAGDSWETSVDDGRVVDVEFLGDGERVFVATDAGVLTLLEAETGAVEASHRNGHDLRWARTTAEASIVTVGGDRARIVAPEW